MSVSPPHEGQIIPGISNSAMLIGAGVALVAIAFAKGRR
jgi:hypothetical protein